MRNVSDENGESESPDETVDHRRAVAFLATKCTRPIDEVARLYELEWAGLKATARIKGFITILTIRRVRDLLREGGAEAPALSSRGSLAN